MSHLKERAEKNCLNCNAEVYGRYCHICGQENLETKESFWSLVTHFAYDVMHFDGKFFSTLKYLLLKPGFLSYEYLRGRRASYLHPIRMYVFTSAIFFLILFGLIVKMDDIENNLSAVNSPLSEEHMAVLKDSIVKAEVTAKDSTEKQKLEELLSAVNYYAANKTDSLNTNSKDTTQTKSEKGKLHINFFGGNKLPNTVQEYDSIQNALPEAKRDGWFTRITSKWAISVWSRYEKNPEKFQENFIEKFFHSVPQVMFITLPLIALFMQLLYLRKRKQVFYVNHVIFLTHVYIALFICWLVIFGIDALHTVSGWSIFNWISFLVGTYMFIYTPWAMKFFYEQGIVKSVFKYFILLFAAFFFFLVVFSVYAIKAM